MMRRHGAVATAVATLVATAAVATAPAPASADAHWVRPHQSKTVKAADAPESWYVGHAGGTQVQALGTSIKSDYTSASGVEGYALPANDTRRAAGVNVGAGLVRVGGVTTWARAEPAAGGGTRIVTGARTADVSLLGGVIAADAVETVTTASKKGSALASSSSTKFVGLTIAGQSYGANVPKDTTVTIPGVATVTLNSSWDYQAAGGSYITGFGMYVSLLQPFQNLPSATTVLLNPTQSVVVPAPPPYAAQLGGIGYGSAVKATVGPALDAGAGPSALLFTPPGGTGSETMRNSTADIKVPSVLSLGAVRTETQGATMARRARVTMTNRVAGVNVLDGLITADAVTAFSKTSKRFGEAANAELSTELLNLVVAGQSIPADAAPNTAFDIANVGHLVVNEQVREAWGGYVRALHLTLTTEKYGLPVGAEIELGVALTYIVE